MARPASEERRRRQGLQMQVRAVLEDGGIGEYSQSLKQAANAALKIMGEEIYANFDKNQFEWRPLSIATQRQRRLLGYGAQGPRLIRDGRLRNELATNVSRVSSDGRELFIGTDNVIALTQNNGGGQYNQIPARPFLELDDGQIDKLIEAYADGFVENWHIKG